ncbi:DNA primase [Lishizhenia sp.]|uniref:DNA primase n=1 Tax=Lishizhenia sp. TaxID=2497594 RepID=UPI00299E0D3E|nr:DNA primase [Lishizhenia sp.]MDX1445246.1 DNA primase [Lishizhenia sp.]
MARIPQHIIDEIMETSRIEEVIGEFVNLKRAGSSLKGLSPFTDEKTPSFIVSPAKQIFKCFSTGKGGTVVTFLMEKEHFSYPEALRWLADKYHIELPEEKPLTPEEQEQLTERESLHIVNDFAKDFFVEHMHESDEGKAIALSYFRERGLRDDIIKKFQLGFCPQNSKSLTDVALEKGYQLKYLKQVGLTKEKDGRTFDFFRGRVMFPIHSVSGKTLGFGGRTLKSDKKIAKYFNSPESIIYNKSEVLYGLYFAKGDMIKYDNCYLVEGYTDVISLHQSGIENVVASSGTSLTTGQIRLIKRYTNNITILYDGDAAGIKASFRGIDLILEEGLNVKVVLFPDGDDPDSYSKKVSSTELQEYIDQHKQDFVSFKTDLLLGEGGDDPLKRATLIKDIVASIALIPDSITRQVYLQNTATRFEMPEQTLLIELNKLRGKHQQQAAKAAQRAQQRPPQTQQKATPTQQPTPQKAQMPEDMPPDDFFDAPFPDMPDEAMMSQGGGTSVRTPQPLKEEKYYANELDLIRILLKYGTRAIESEHKDELGQTETVESSVIELIVYEVERDELNFTSPILSKIYNVFKEGVNENILYGVKHFLRSDDQDIVRVVSEIESSPFELSRHWMEKHNIDINQEIHRLNQAVLGALYSFKICKINERIDEIRDIFKNDSNLGDENMMDLLAEQMALEKVKGKFATKLGRIIL